MYNIVHCVTQIHIQNITVSTVESKGKSLMHNAYVFCIHRISSNIYLANELNTCECFPVPTRTILKDQNHQLYFLYIPYIYIRYYQQNVLRSHSSIWLCTVDKNKKLAEFPHCVQTNYQLFAMLACICIYGTIKAGRSLTLSRTFSPVAGTEQKRIVSFRRKLLYKSFYLFYFFPCDIFPLHTSDM